MRRGGAVTLGHQAKGALSYAGPKSISRYLHGTVVLKDALEADQCYYQCPPTLPASMQPGWQSVASAALDPLVRQHTWP